MDTQASTRKPSGGILRNARIRAAYLASPKLCLFCRSPILPKDGEKLKHARKKTFCSQACNARHRVAIGAFDAIRVQGARARKPGSGSRPCRHCADRPAKPNRRLCQECLDAFQVRLSARTKAESNHREIRGHAAGVVKGRPRVCVNCGYDKHAEACHIRPVADFPPDSTCAEINHPGNLVMLCPNCHWEHDHGMLSPRRIVAAGPEVGVEPT